MTGINYLDETWSPVTGCSGKGCKVRDNCWAWDMVRRFPEIHGAGWKIDPFSKPRFHPDRLDKPLHWRKPRRIGLCFIGDWMDDQVRCEWIDQMLDVMSACPQHQFFSLTKQPQNLEEKIYGHCPESPARELGGGDYLPNLYNGVSITDQEDAARMLPELLRIPGKHWVSVEPMLGPVKLCHCERHGTNNAQACLSARRGKYISDDWCNCWCHRPRKGPGIDWLVIGCESGKNRRPCPIEWMVDVVQQCQAAGVPVWVKQIDLNGKVCHDINLFPEALKVRQLP